MLIRQTLHWCRITNAHSRLIDGNRLEMGLDLTGQVDTAELYLLPLHIVVRAEEERGAGSGRRLRHLNASPVGRLKQAAAA